ncbi:TIGR01777 family oxidoreductase [Edaphobacillus lindanitolerans]|uniref:TIGR01777 family protein n=1 Tax=Edaphobacillus lindanitolerans TaxID=550447 RepID=A0A1U7PTX4_9BACI|nr:TIGR01777 family oxidoreductase [Edaphobacillus lindanitolerans]SIT93160.1 hypothetical protein SAMN05428946_2964 [Edaphobacillus lindanitolerans]
MKIAITGGTGFLGRTLVRLLIENGHEPVILTRNPGNYGGPAREIGYLRDGSRPELELGETDAIVNLAGTSINDGRWTDERKADIRESRIRATAEVLRIIRALPVKPEVLVNASAVGVYPYSETDVFTEDSRQGDGFLPGVVREWEWKARSAEEFGVRTVFMRFGILLGRGGGALPLISLPYRLFAGGTVGSGRQWVSWIHVEDAARAILFAIEAGSLSGPVNTVAPGAVRMKDFGKEVGRALGRPHWMPAPSFALKAALGQKSEIVLKGQHVVPARLREAGFEFQFPEVRSALEYIYQA